MTFKKKWENYWYHYKFHTIFGLIVIILAFVGIKSCVDSENIDFHMVFLSDTYVSPEAEQKIENALTDGGVVRDTDGDGKASFYMDSLMIGFDAESNNDMTTMQKLQTVIYAGQHTLMLVHEYALEDYDGVFEDISHKADGAYKTYSSPGEDFVSGISVEGNTLLEDAGIDTDMLYVAMRRRSNKEAEQDAGREAFDMAYDAMDYILSFNPKNE